ncbi:cytosol aminopeptidase-like [Limulus polyphemus]|uniref:Cytosol aminopeptidase n=1 Tax=Limulus polyphemus TaxID=6850 RepID=A0ABM1BB12_LIMPO|nr:cytosol aminopeptidase-like [Limulus polyphemus]
MISTRILTLRSWKRIGYMKFQRITSARNESSQTNNTNSNDQEGKPSKRGLILGVYEKQDKSEGIIFTSSADKFNKVTSGKLQEHLILSGSSLKKGKNRIFYGLDKEYPCVSVVGLGPKNAGFNELEEIEEQRENIRIGVSGGVKQLQELGVTEAFVDSCGDSEAAAEGASLSLFTYDELKKESSRKPKVDLHLFDSEEASLASWKRGLTEAEGQNLARTLMETPANIMTPTRFAEHAEEVLSDKGVSVIKRDKAWAESKKMEAFLSVAKGSEEPPVFLELAYHGIDKGVKPLVIVGKGITFDSGGISLKPAAGMEAMRGDMGGAACTIGTIYTLAALKAPVNVIGLIPLCENMPNGRANKPGDVVTAMNGKTIQIDNTDAEGRLILADALCYACTFNPLSILDMATLTGAIVIALGSGATAVFTNSFKMWQMINQAGMRTGDRVWRMPLFQHYTKQVTESHLADLNNVGKHNRQAGSCTAAAFLKEFVPVDNWLHLDIAGVMENKDEVPYLSKGMSGRPTRTVVEFVQKVFKEKV